MGSPLAGKRALVTGAGRRLGRGIAERLGSLGMRVIVHCHASRTEAEGTVQAIRARGAEAEIVQANLLERGEARKLAERATAVFGGLDLLVSSAANFERVELDAIDDGAWDRAMRLNFEAPVWLAHALRNELRKSRGSVVFVTDAAASRAHRHYFPYLLSKSALSQAVRTLAVELAPDVRVNAVAPGAVLLPEEYGSEARVDAMRRVPLRGTVTAGSGVDAVCDAVTYLAEADFVSGAEVVVDGGESIA